MTADGRRGGTAPRAKGWEGGRERNTGTKDGQEKTRRPHRQQESKNHQQTAQERSPSSLGTCTIRCSVIPFLVSFLDLCYKSLAALPRRAWHRGARDPFTRMHANLASAHKKRSDQCTTGFRGSARSVDRSNAASASSSSSPMTALHGEKGAVQGVSAIISTHKRPRPPQTRNTRTCCRRG